MELHTLGVDGGYTQSDVTSLAHILTGWTLGDSSAAAVRTRCLTVIHRCSGVDSPSFHDGTMALPQTFLKRKFGNGGLADGEAALLMLAEHPSTARHISFQLAQYFVADQPSSELVSEMAAVFRKTDGDLRAVVRTMLASKEFRASANFGSKFKTPYQYVVSVARVAGLKSNECRAARRGA